MQLSARQIVLIAVLAAALARADGPSFEKDIKPLIDKYCISCHNSEKHKGDLDLARFQDNASAAQAAGLWQRAAIRVRIDAEDKPIGVTLNGREGRIATTNVETGAVATDGYDMIVAPVELTLRAAIALKSQTDHPILLVDQLGRPLAVRALRRHLLNVEVRSLSRFERHMTQLPAHAVVRDHVPC